MILAAFSNLIESVILGLSFKHRKICIFHDVSFGFHELSVRVCYVFLGFFQDP